jgi:hypothetical protein
VYCRPIKRVDLLKLFSRDSPIHINARWLWKRAGTVVPLLLLAEYCIAWQQKQWHAQSGRLISQVKSSTISWVPQPHFFCTVNTVCLESISWNTRMAEWVQTRHVLKVSEHHELKRLMHQSFFQEHHSTSLVVSSEIKVVQVPSTNTSWFSFEGPTVLLVCQVPRPLPAASSLLWKIKYVYLFEAPNSQTGPPTSCPSTVSPNCSWIVICDQKQNEKQNTVQGKTQILGQDNPRRTCVPRFPESRY